MRFKSRAALIALMAAQSAATKLRFIDFENPENLLESRQEIGEEPIFESAFIESLVSKKTEPQATPTPKSGTHMLSTTGATSDPIHGSLGPPPVAVEDLTDSQKFEYHLRHIKPMPIKDDAEHTDSLSSLAWAEKSMGLKLNMKIPEDLPHVPNEEASEAAQAEMVKGYQIDDEITHTDASV